jgi:hypothetical protein
LLRSAGTPDAEQIRTQARLVRGDAIHAAHP